MNTMGTGSSWKVGGSVLRRGLDPLVCRSGEPIHVGEHAGGDVVVEHFHLLADVLEERVRLPTSEDLDLERRVVLPAEH